MITEEQLKKLPKYAQKEIDLWRRNYEYAMKLVRKVEGEEESRVILDPFIQKIPLPDNLTIEFRLSDSPQDRIEIDVKHGRMKIHAMQSLLVLPRAANSIELSTEIPGY